MAAVFRPERRDGMQDRETSEQGDSERGTLSPPGREEWPRKRRDRGERSSNGPLRPRYKSSSGLVISPRMALARCV